MLLCRFILLEADPELTPWSKICVSQADCILLVAAPEAGSQVRLQTRTLPPQTLTKIVSLPSCADPRTLSPLPEGPALCVKCCQTMLRACRTKEMLGRVQDCMTAFDVHDMDGLLF